MAESFSCGGGGGQTSGLALETEQEMDSQLREWQPRIATPDSQREQFKGDGGAANDKAVAGKGAAVETAVDETVDAAVMVIEAVRERNLDN